MIFNVLHHCRLNIHIFDECTFDRKSFALFGVRALHTPMLVQYKSNTNSWKYHPTVLLLFYSWRYQHSVWPHMLFRQLGIYLFSIWTNGACDLSRRKNVIVSQRCRCIIMAYKHLNHWSHLNNQSKNTVFSNILHIFFFACIYWCNIECSKPCEEKMTHIFVLFACSSLLGSACVCWCYINHTEPCEEEIRAHLFSSLCSIVPTLFVCIDAISNRESNVLDFSRILCCTVF